MLRILSKNLGSVCILSLQGKLVIGETAGLLRVVQSFSEASAVVVDMAQVSTIDARGVGVLLELREELRAKGIEFQLRNVTKLVSHVLELSRLNSVFKVASDVSYPAFSCRRLTPTSKLASCA